jgi:hypothetical protein
MADYNNTRDSSLPDPASPGFLDGDTITLQNGSKFSRQCGRWEPIAFQSGSAESPVTVILSAQGVEIPGTPEAPHILAQSPAWSPATASLMPMPVHTMIDTCQSGWSNHTGTGTVTIDTTDGYAGQNSVKITCGANTTTDTIAKKILAAPIDMTGKQLGIVLKFTAGSLAKISELRVYLLDLAGTNFFSWVPIRGTNQAPKVRDGRWDKLHLSFAGAALTGTDPRAAIQQIRVAVIPYSSEVPPVASVGVAYGFPKSNLFANGVVSLTFDDGYAGCPEFAKRMAAYGYRGTGNIIPEYLNDAAGNHMTTAVCRSLKSVWGWELAQHGDIYWGVDVTDNAKWRAYMAQTKAKMIALGAGAGCNVFAYPGGQQDYSVQDDVALLNAVGRTIDHGASNTFPIPECLPPGNWLSTWAMSSISSFAGATPIATVTNAITKARAEGAWLILVFHRGTSGVPVNSMYCNYDDFNTILAAIAASGMDCLPMGEVATSPF